MSPERSFIVEPVVSSDEAGEETIRDFQVISHNKETVEAFNRGHFDDYTVDSEGRWYYNYQDIEEEAEYQESSFDEGAYIEAIQESEPELANAMDWAADNLPEHLLDQYNQQIESGSLDDLHAAVEWLMEQYEESADYEQASTDEQYADDEYDDDAPSYLTEDAKARVDELSEDEADILNETIDDLTETAPAGAEYSEQWQDYASQLYDSGEECAAEVAVMTAKYHNGEVSAEEAIATVMNRWDLRQLNEVYEFLAQYR
jgi:hypothetical protein